MAGSVKSCGCLHIETARAHAAKMGKKHGPTQIGRLAALGGRDTRDLMRLVHPNDEAEADRLWDLAEAREELERMRRKALGVQLEQKYKTHVGVTDGQ